RRAHRNSSIHDKRLELVSVDAARAKAHTQLEELPHQPERIRSTEEAVTRRRSETPAPSVMQQALRCIVVRVVGESSCQQCQALACDALLQAPEPGHGERALRRISAAGEEEEDQRCGSLERVGESEALAGMVLERGSA